MAYVNDDDKKEWEETYEMLLLKEPVSTVLSVGEYVTIDKGLFDAMVGEINQSRIKLGNPEDGVELIVVDDNED